MSDTAESVVRHIGGNFEKMGVPTLYSWIIPWAQPHNLRQLPPGIRRGKMKQCFENAFKVAAEHDWKYAEGFAIGAAGIIVHHAWVVDDSGQAIEVTWKKGSSYFGIPIPVSVARDIILKHKVWGLLPHGIKELEPYLKAENKHSE